MKKEEKIKIFIWIFFVLVILQFPIIIFLGNMRSAAFDMDFYKAEFRKYDPDVENRINITENLLFYLKEPKADRDYIEPFTRSEEGHLFEVKILLHNFFRLFYVSVVLLLASFFIILVLDQKNILKKTGLSLVSGGLLTALFSYIFYKIIMLDFNLSFTKFHHIFFRLGNWQFPPEYILVTLFPGQFWIDIISKIIRGIVNTTVLTVLVGVLLLLIYFYKESKGIKFLKSGEGILFKIKNIWK
jgi:integral membrane protein (TIGR01906 family)